MLKEVTTSWDVFQTKATHCTDNAEVFTGCNTRSANA